MASGSQKSTSLESLSEREDERENPQFQLEAEGEETTMPPPLPYYTRDHQSPGSVLRVSSAPISFRESHEKKFLLSWRSMPSLNTSRQQHNRQMGSTAEFSANDREKLQLRVRSEEFEALLANL